MIFLEIKVPSFNHIFFHQGKVAKELILEDLSNCDYGNPDVIVEVAHPDISKQYGHIFLKVELFGF